MIRLLNGIIICAVLFSLVSCGRYSNMEVYEKDTMVIETDDGEVYTVTFDYMCKNTIHNIIK